MLNIKVVAVGTLKEKFWKEACNKYIKRLGRFCKISVQEIAESSLQNTKQVLAEESKHLLSKLSGFVVVLAIEGKKLSSTELSEKLCKLAIDSVSEICFVIGSSHGLDQSVIDRADLLLSFSDMTFPHQLMRVILLEQVYRAFSIDAKMPYHK